jgi:hypothetical protein
MKSNPIKKQTMVEFDFRFIANKYNQKILIVE